MRKKVMKGCLTLLLSWIVLIILILVCSNYILVSSSYTLTYENLPPSFDNFKIVHLSDLHHQEFGHQNERLIQKIQMLKPDIVVMTGDMILATAPDLEKFETFIKSVAKQYPVFYIIGNHEQALEVSVLASLYEILNRYEVFVLDNDYVTLSRGEDQMNLYGMWFNLRYYSDKTNQTILNDIDTYFFDEEKMIEILGENDDDFSILLTHNPVYFETYAAWEADLTLSGHLHGGMIRLPFIGGVISSEKTWFPYYDAGVFSENQHRLVVSRGLSAGHSGFRFLNCPEVVEIILQRENSH